MADTRSGGATATPRRPRLGIDVDEPPAPTVEAVAHDPRQPTERPLFVHEALGRELGDGPGRRHRALPLVGLLDPDEVAQPEQLFPEPLEGQWDDLLAQHPVPESGAAVAVGLADL